MKSVAASRCAVGAILVLMVLAPAAAYVWNVDTVPELNTAVWSASAGDEIRIADGTYNLSSVLQMNTPGVTIRGASGNRDGVILVGGGMNTRGVDEGITVGASNVSVRDLTLKDFYFNAVHLRAESDISGITVSNVKTWNVGERHVKGSWDNNLSHTLDNTLIENMYMLQTIERTGHPDTSPDYIGGMDIMATNNLTIRDCVAEGIHGQTGEGNASIFLWQGHNNFTIERNVTIGTNKGIGIGLCYQAGQTISGGWHANGGVIRNNTVLRTDGTGGNNIGLELCGLKNVQVLNNTIYSPNAAYFRNVSFWDDAGIPISNLLVQDNIFRGGVYDIASGDWSASAVAAMGNIVDTIGNVVVPAWFADVSTGDFHLTPAATLAIDHAQAHPSVTDDLDGLPRPIGPFPDVGADEYNSVVPPQPPSLPPTPPPAGEPYVDWSYKYLGDGKYAVTFTVRGNDGQQRAFFVNATFEGANEGQIQQTQAFGAIDVDSSETAALYDQIPEANYDLEQDSWFFEPFPGNQMALEEGANSYHIEAGTGGGSQYLDVELAYIVTTGDLDYSGVISRLSVNWPFSATLILAPAGDANYDGEVDGADYTIWADHYQQGGAGWGGGDFNGDGTVDGADYTIWADFYGTGQSSGAPVPEPLTAVLLLAGALFVARRRRP